MTLFGAARAAIGISALVLAGAALAKPAKAPKPKPAPVLKLVRAVPHSGYSEGLDFYEGYLWNATPTSIAKINPADGAVLAQYTPATEYSESVTWFKGSLWNLSFTNNGLYRGTIHVENGESRLVFQRAGSVPEVHGWGLTHDGTHLISTGDYSKKLYFIDPNSGKVARTLETDQTALEDLAWDGKGIWTSSFTQHRGQIFRIDPVSGKSSVLFSLPDREACPVIDGIAVEGKQLWITGKHCPQLYLVELPLVDSELVGF